MPFTSMSDVTPALRGIEPPITLVQANAIANIADNVTGVDNPWAVAISSFKKSHMIKDDKWITKEGSEFGKKEVEIETMNCGVKAITTPSGEQYIALWTANAFQDREGETFATKSLQDYVTRVDITGECGRVWWWHVKGTDFADIVWQGVHGRFLLELAKPDKTDYGQKMFHNLQHPEEFPELLPRGWGTSHGYVYLPSWKQYGVYGMMHKFETTVLPAHRASNIYGGIPKLFVGGSKMSGKVTQAKKDGLEELVGEKNAAMLLEMTEKATELLEDSDISWKELFEDEKAFPPKVTKPVKKAGEDEDDEDEEDEDEEDEAEDENKGKKDDGDVFEMELGDELLKEIASHVDVTGQVKEAVQESLKELLPGVFKEMQKGLKEIVVETTAATKEQIVKDAIAGKITLKPSIGSKDDSNTLEQSVIDAIEGKKKEKQEEGTKAKNTDPIAQVVSNMMSGN